MISEFLAVKVSFVHSCLDDVLTFSKSSCALDSVCFSSSDGFGGMLGTDANCE